MLQTFPVVSLVAAIPPVLITVDAPNRRRGKRTALFIARTVNRIAEPTVVDEHAAAVLYRQMILANNNATRLPDLNGPREPWWAKPTTIADCYDEQ
jgi:hypothetical protein